jgi:polyisoprenoid-binding protein YceI
MSDTTTTTLLPLESGTWTFDPAHSSVHFKVRHLGLTNVRGRFNDFDASLSVGDSLEATHLTATVQIASVDTNQADRDAHLLGTDFFSAEQHPTIEFVSTLIRDLGDGDYEADGDLTVNGITKPVTLKVEFTGRAVHPADGRERAGFTATARIAREDFGVDFNMPIGLDKVALGKKIDIEIDIQFTAPQAA